MKPLHYALSIILFVQIGFSQNTKLIDSLKQSYKSSISFIDKIKTGDLIVQELKHKNPEETYNYINDMLSTSIQNKYKKGIGISLRNKGYYFRFKPNVDSARYSFKKSLKILSENKNSLEAAKTCEEFATFECVQGNYNEAIEIAETGYNHAKTNNNGEYMAVALNRKVTTLMDKGDFKEATIINLLSLNIIDSLKRKKPLLKAVSLGHKARIEMLRGNYKLVLEPLLESIKILKSIKNTKWLAVNFMEIGNAYWYLNDYDNALNSYTTSLNYSKEINRKDFISMNLSNIASLQIKKGSYNEALKTLLGSVPIEKQIGSKINLTIAYNSLGEVYSLKKNYAESLKYYNLGIQLADSIKATDVILDSYYGRAETYEKQGNYKAALADRKKFQVLNDSIFNKTKSKQIEELKTIYETEKKEAQIALQNEEINTLNVQAENDKLIKTLYAIGMFSFLAIAGLLYFGFKQRIKKNKLAREKQEEIYKQEIEFKQKELASQTLHLVQKNTFIQELKENLEKIKQSPELFKVEFRRLVMLLKKESAEDKDWEVFKSYFSEVHNNFDNKLKAIYADISEKEIRLASFLRMNLSTKEIASMLNVLPESVLKSKYRLKKKLKLDKETDLGSFLNGL
ncbi:hypothetical protein PK35_08505 [Tamlana nanhaiensis]|uniref:Uncharacterized protein n=1 Tax=Neotamlana nanhaiensis TaxID=1382798 RepID=A0A0D7W1N6_9FLAO|nr:tetratricopeptide repeat protein [Tamlana nanhaiensis]KJD33001.1 hypothetical protein PK35_08505 [Tamlana nanhaiensis]